MSTVRDDTLTRITTAYRNAKTDAAKLGPALGIAILRAGFSFDVISEDIGYSKQTVYTWVFGRSYPHRTIHKRIRELTALLERATAKGGVLPVLTPLGSKDERSLLIQVRAQYSADTVT